jgi:pyruvate/2-oxoacid:ferredoxin oxidoreductase beta subunit
MTRALDVLEGGIREGEWPEWRFDPGHNACPGCGATLAAKIVLTEIGDNAIYFVPASCASLYFDPSGTAAARAPVVHTVFAAAFAEAEGMAYGLKIRGREERVVVWAGDGASYDIGFGGLSGVAARGADILVICNDNEGYQNTGGHESTATPPDARKKGSTVEVPRMRKKDIIGILEAHDVPYLATASIAFPEDMRMKLRKAISIKGFRFILLLNPCVTWGYESKYTVKLARLSVETGYFPLYEIEGGVLRITHEPEMRPLEDFTSLQSRFRGVNLERMKEEMRERWERLLLRAKRSF